MAENKNGFVLYRDLISVVKKLVLKDRENKTNYGGELFLLILEYVNDENPVPIDFILEMTFEPIKAQLKRDLKKYETKINKNSEAGRIGNLKRWHPDLFQKYEKGILTLIKAEEIADGRKCDKSIAKIADIDTVTDTDIDSDTDILLKKETKGGDVFNPESSEDKIPIPEERKKVAPKKEIPEPPDLDTFFLFAKEIYQGELKSDFSPYEFAVRSKYESWVGAGWKDGNGKAILNWKSKLKNTIPHLKAIYNNGNSNNHKPSTGKISGHQYAAGKLREHFTANSAGGDYSIDVEAIEQRKPV